MTADPKWNACLFHLCSLWNRLGPDRTLAVLKVAAASEVSAEGVVLLDIAPREKGAA